MVHLPVGPNDQEHGRGLDAKVLEHIILPLLDMAKLHPPCIVHGQSFQQHRWRLVVLGEEVSLGHRVIVELVSVSPCHSLNILCVHERERKVAYLFGRLQVANKLDGILARERALPKKAKPSWISCPFCGVCVCV